MSNLHKQPEGAVEGDIWAREELGDWVLVTKRSSSQS